MITSVREVRYLPDWFYLSKDNETEKGHMVEVLDDAAIRRHTPMMKPVKISKMNYVMMILLKELMCMMQNQNQR